MAYFKKGKFSIVYDKAIRPDGSLFFPQRLNQEFLDEQRRVLGSYIFFNQYLNEIIPYGEQDFKHEWLRYYVSLPKRYNTFAFIDPAISLSEKADYTALAVVHVDEQNDWYVEVAKRQRLTATQTVELIFQVNRLFKPKVLGVEAVAYQQALIHFVEDEMRKRDELVPIAAIRRGPDKTKETRIRGLIPRFEWNRIFVNQGMVDFENEYSKFPKSSHDDILDALSSIEELVMKPHEIKEQKRVPTPHEPEYESELIKKYVKKANRQGGF